MQNASCGSTWRPLRPTYRLFIGIPGSQRLCPSPAVWGCGGDHQRAKKLINADIHALEDTLEQLEKLRQQLERDRAESEKKLRQAEADLKKAGG